MYAGAEEALRPTMPLTVSAVSSDGGAWGIVAEQENKWYKFGQMGLRDTEWKR